MAVPLCSRVLKVRDNKGNWCSEHQTHSTPEVRLAIFLVFLIFGTAERTPFARKAKLDISRGKTLIPTPDIWQARVLQLAKCPGFTPEL